MPVDMAQTSSGLSQPMERCATTTAAKPFRMATRGSRRLVSAPTGRARPIAWRQRLGPVAVDRDRHGIGGSDPLGPAPSGQGPRLDYQRAELAAGQALTTCSDKVRWRHGPEQRIDSQSTVASCRTKSSW